MAKNKPNRRKANKWAGKEAELGATGTLILGGIVSNSEYNKKLEGTQGYEIYEKMHRSDATVRALLQSIFFRDNNYSILFKMFFQPNFKKQIKLFRMFHHGSMTTFVHPEQLRIR